MIQSRSMSDWMLAPGMVKKAPGGAPTPKRSEIRNKQFEAASAEDRLRGRDIKQLFTMVEVKDPNSGVVGPPELLDDVLRRFDKKRYHVELVSPTRPLVKIIDRHEAASERKDKFVAQKSGLNKSRKEVQFSWGVSRADLDAKLAKAREGLTARHPVDVVLVHKRGQEVQAEARDAVLEYIKNALAGYANFRGMQSGPGRTILGFDLLGKNVLIKAMNEEES